MQIALFPKSSKVNSVQRNWCETVCSQIKSRLYKSVFPDKACNLLHISFIYSRKHLMKPFNLFASNIKLPWLSRLHSTPNRALLEASSPLALFWDDLPRHQMVHAIHHLWTQHWTKSIPTEKNHLRCIFTSDNNYITLGCMSQMTAHRKLSHWNENNITWLATCILDNCQLCP